MPHSGSCQQLSGPLPTIPDMESAGATVLDPADLDRIGLEVDMRIADVWALLFERGDDVDTEFLGWLLRLAYVTGYWDSLSEPERGALCTRLGYPVPSAASVSSSWHG